MKLLVAVLSRFQVLANEVNSKNNIAISTFLYSLPLACLVLTRTIN